MGCLLKLRGLSTAIDGTAEYSKVSISQHLMGLSLLSNFDLASAISSPNHVRNRVAGGYEWQHVFRVRDNDI